MLEDFRNASPLEFAAFFELGQFITGDIEAVSTELLTQEYDGENIASLAFGLDTLGIEERQSFRLALKETGLPRMPNQNESVWLAVRYLLNQIVEDQENAMNYLHAIIDLEREWGRIELFERPDCDRYFSEMKERFPYAGSSYAAQGWGIEKLYGLYYSSDDWKYKGPLIFRDRWLTKMEEKQRQDVIKEAKIVLKRFYSINDTLPDCLSGLDEFKKWKEEKNNVHTCNGRGE